MLDRSIGLDRLALLICQQSTGGTAITQISRRRRLKVSEFSESVSREPEQTFHHPTRSFKILFEHVLGTFG
jgi:hypothetical protein